MARKPPPAPSVSRGKFVLGEMLRALRTKRGLGQKACAELLGITHQSIVGHESGEHAISEATLLRYAKAYELESVLDLLIEGIALLRPPQASPSTPAPSEPRCSGEADTPPSCCPKAGQYNGFGSDGPRAFDCPASCPCHD